jgi:hypothetical protein
MGRAERRTTAPLHRKAGHAYEWGEAGYQTFY